VTYIHGQSTIKTRAVAMTADEARRELANLNRLRAAILAETEAKAKELDRIRKARLRLQPVATYAPTPAALAYREQYGHIIASQPMPLHGGERGLQRAVREAQEVEDRKRQAVA